MIEITYHKEGDYLVPDLYLEEDYEKDYHIGKYGYLRLEYLRNHKKAEYIIMFMNKTLRKHIVETDKQAKERFELLIVSVPNLIIEFKQKCFKYIQKEI